MGIGIFKKNNQNLDTLIPSMFFKKLNLNNLSFKDLYKLFLIHIKFINFALIKELMDKKIAYNEIIELLEKDYFMRKEETILNIHSFIVQSFPSSIFNNLEQRKKYYSLFTKTIIYIKPVFLSMDEIHLKIIKNDFLKSFEMFFSFLFNVLNLKIIYNKKDEKIWDNFLPLISREHTFLYSVSTGIFIDLFPFVVFIDDNIYFWNPDFNSLFGYIDENGKNSIINKEDIKNKFLEYLENFLLSEQLNELLYDEYNKEYVNIFNSLIKIKKDIINKDYVSLINNISNYKYSNKVYDDFNNLLEYHIANAYQKIGNEIKAKSLFENLIEHSPDFYYPYINLFSIYLNSGDLAKLGTISKKLKKIVFSHEITGKIDKLMDSVVKKKKMQYKNIGKELIDLKEKVENKAPVVIGRNSETEEILYILNCMKRNSVLIVGEPGVGKTSVVHNVVNRILNEDVPDNIKELPIYELNVGLTFSGTKYRGQLEEKIQQILSKIKDEKAILFIDDLNFLISSDTSKSSTMDFPSLIKPFLEEDNIRIIAVTNHDNYISSISKIPVFGRLFQTVTINELSDEENSIILKLKASEFEKYHNVQIDIDNIIKYFSLIKQFFREKMLPDKAIELLDRACAKVNFDVLKGNRDDNTVTETDFLKIIADTRGVELSSVSIQLKDKLKSLEENLSKSIKGQGRVIKSLVKTLLPSKMGLKIKDSKPDGIFLFIGPTGVGKTELAKILARELYGDEKKLLRFDMSEYMEEFTFSRLIGAAPGYVGYYDQNQLTDEMKKDPYRVVLLDEIEKAHPQLINIFLQVFDSGVLTDARGKKAYFDKSIIIMTSNIGTSLFSKINVGFSKKEGDKKVTRMELENEMKKFFKPEFLNRVDAILFFNSLDISVMKEIVVQKIEELNQTLINENIKITLNDDAVEYIAKKGYSEEYGAREILRVIQDEILLKIADYKLNNNENIKDIFFIMENDELKLLSQDKNGVETVIYNNDSDPLKTKKYKKNRSNNS
jgi:ATP-dependent Clp protease ATP-binding subunit ClpA